MYLPNQIVEYNGSHGRVIFDDPIEHCVHILLRTNTNAWKIEKCDPLFCKPAFAFLWTIESVFQVRRQRTAQTPQLVPMEVVDIDHVMEL